MLDILARLQTIADNQTAGNEKLEKLDYLEKLDVLDSLKSFTDGQASVFEKLDNSFETFKGAISELANRMLTMKDMYNIADENVRYQQIAGMTNSTTQDVYQMVNVGNRYGASQESSLMFYQDMAKVNSAIATNSLARLSNGNELKELNRVAPNTHVLDKMDDKGHVFSVLERIDNIRKALAELNRINPDKARAIAERMAHGNEHFYDLLLASQKDYQTVFQQELSNSRIEGSKKVTENSSESSEAKSRLDSTNHANDVQATSYATFYMTRMANALREFTEKHGGIVAITKAATAITNDVNDKIGVIKTIFTAVTSFIGTVVSIAGLFKAGKMLKVASGIIKAGKVIEDGGKIAGKVSIVDKGLKAVKSVGKGAGTLLSYIPGAKTLGKWAGNIGSGTSGLFKKMPSVGKVVGKTIGKLPGVKQATEIAGVAARAISKIPHDATLGRIAEKVGGFAMRHVLPKVAAGIFGGPVGWAFDIASLAYDGYSAYKYFTGKPSGKIDKAVKAGAVATTAGVAAYQVYKEITKKPPARADKPVVTPPVNKPQMLKTSAAPTVDEMSRAKQYYHLITCNTNNNQQYYVNIVVQPSTADPMQIAKQIHQEFNQRVSSSMAHQIQKLPV